MTRAQDNDPSDGDTTGSAAQAEDIPGALGRSILTDDSIVDVYCAHFGLTERPFSLQPDPSFLFWTPQHRRAYTMLEYGILIHAPITLITGEVGAGKTTLLHHLMNNLDDSLRVGLVSNALGGRKELLRWVLMAFGLTAGSEETHVDLFARFQDFLIEQYAEGRRVILIFDEAQNLSRESLEELRMFSNINSGKDEILQLILVGQPELKDLVRSPGMSQFAQRISSHYHLPAMDVQTVEDYIRHRLKLAGAKQSLFTKDAVDLIYETTGGVPRLVNQLCDLAMLYTFSFDRTRVNRERVEQVLADGSFFVMGDRSGQEESPK